MECTSILVGGGLLHRFQPQGIGSDLNVKTCPVDRIQALINYPGDCYFSLIWTRIGQLNSLEVLHAYD